VQCKMSAPGRVKTSSSTEPEEGPGTSTGPEQCDRAWWARIDGCTEYEVSKVAFFTFMTLCYMFVLICLYYALTGLVALP